MKNMMKEYLGNEYSENHLRNFCLYWMKAADGRGHVRSLIPGLDPYKAKWLNDEDEIYAALEYMIDFLEKRLSA